MAKFHVRVYVSSYVDKMVEAENYNEAQQYVEDNSDLWFEDNQILEHVELQEGESEVTKL